MAKRTKLSAMADAAKPKDVPSSEDPMVELRRLLDEHRNRHKNIQREFSQSLAEVTWKDGTVHKSPLRQDDRDMAAEHREKLMKLQKKCRDKITAQLKLIPIYQHFLSKVAGKGPVLCALLVCKVNIRIAFKPSKLRRYCGVAPDNDTGRLEKPKPLTAAELEENKRREKAGEPPIPGRHYVEEIRTELFKWSGQLMREGVRDGKMVRPCKYLEAWLDFKRGREDVPGKGQRNGAWRSAGFMLDDLYTVWRALEGLEVWCTKHDQDRGHYHGGEPVKATTRMLTLDEALALVGDVGWRGSAESTPGPEEGEDDPLAEWMVAKGEAA